MSNFADRVYEQSRTTGTADLVLLGLIPGYQTFFTAKGVSSPFYYAIAHPTLNEWEVGLSNGVTLVGGNYVLARTTVLKSSNANALVSFSAGLKDARIGLPADIAAKIEPLQATAAIDFPSIAAGTTAELTITVTGAAVGDDVSVVPNGAPESGLVWSGYVSAADTVKVRLANITSGAIDPASRTWRATVRKP